MRIDVYEDGLTDVGRERLEMSVNPGCRLMLARFNRYFHEIS